MSNFMNESEMMGLVQMYRASVEQLRENHDNLLSMMVIVVKQQGGRVVIPYSAFEEIGEGTPYNIRMAPDEQGENMVITVQEEQDDEAGTEELEDSTTDEESPTGSKSTKFHA